MAKPIEIYQVNQIEELSEEAIKKAINELNIALFAISQRLLRLSIPQSTASVTTVANLVTLLENAGIGEE